MNKFKFTKNKVTYIISKINPYSYLVEQNYVDEFGIKQITFGEIKQTGDTHDIIHVLSSLIK